jgi:molecular chaperone HscA
MLHDSFSYAREDMEGRALREQQVEADRLIEDLTGALAKDGDTLLDKGEKRCLSVAIEELAQLRQSNTEYRLLARQIESVGKLSESFAARRMDVSIKSALTGQSLDEIERG